MPFGLHSYSVVFAQDHFPIDFAAGEDLDWYLVIKDARAAGWTVMVRDRHAQERHATPERQGASLSQFRSLAPDETAWFVGAASSAAEEIVVQNAEGRVIARIKFVRPEQSSASLDHDPAV